MKVSFLLVFSIFFYSCTQDKTIDKNQTNGFKSWEMTDFIKADSINPILTPSSLLSFSCPINKKNVNWEERNVLNPSAIIRDNKVHLIYRAQDNQMTSRIGLAISDDGLHFTKENNPIFYPDNDSMENYESYGGVEDPRVVENEEGKYFMTYTAYDGKVARLLIASSTDLRNWVKHGLVLGTGKYKDTWSKAGAIVCRQENNRIIATKINGKYWMYFGDTNLFMATSDDLITWEVLENEENQKMISVLHPRPGYFDSRLVEPGPYALIRDEGILLIYNASNAANFNDPNLPIFTYAAGQALYDNENPVKLLDRSEKYFIHPNKAFEKTGEVNEVCFVEGMVFYKNKWFLYYGTADSKIAVAVKE